LALFEKARRTETVKEYTPKERFGYLNYDPYGIDACTLCFDGCSLLFFEAWEIKT